MNEYVASPEFKKVVALLKEYYDLNRADLSEIFRSSIVFLKKHWNKTLSPDLKVYDVDIRVQHSVFLKYASLIQPFQKIVKAHINQFSDYSIDKVTILPDYNSFEIVDSEIKTVITDWDEINQGQSKLIELLAKSSDSFDLQNIGNISRTVLKLLANQVYKDEIHKPEDKTIDVSQEKFKNRLTAYISEVLKDHEDEKFRNFAKAAIDSVEKSVDLANNVTHKIGVERIFAEVCIIGTIGAISIIKLIHKQSVP